MSGPAVRMRRASTRTRSHALALAGLLVPYACGPSRASDDPAVQAEARQIWKDRCANCHGPTGNGDGPQARHLLVAPRRLSDPAWRASVTDEHLRTVILEGGPAVGLDPGMAPNPDLRARPEVLDALVEHLRALPPSAR
jgi:mono/diheme cytochrome c family protein